MANIPLQLQVALIAAVVSIILFIITEIVRSRQRHRDGRTRIRTIYHSYADPLASAAVALLWRLDEIFDPRGSGFYLSETRHRTKYELYKATSTLYRLATMLGWIQALRRELVFVPGDRPKNISRLEGSLQSFSAALAEGGHVERARVTSLCALWGIEITEPESVLNRLGHNLDYIVKRYVHDHRASGAARLGRSEIDELCRTVADTLAAGLSAGRVKDDVLLDSTVRAVEFLDVRECWIYRDWQAAIGDVMINSSINSYRAYEVIGYREFEALCTSGSDDSRKWIRRLYDAIDNLDVTGDRQRDARIQQLADVMVNTAKVVMSLHAVEPRASKITDRSLQVARCTLQLGSSSP